MKLKLTPTDAKIIEHRLSAETLPEVAADSDWSQHNPEAVSEAVGEASDRLLQAVTPLQTKGGEIEVSSPIDAWCIADCVEGSTWDGQGGFDWKECDKYRRQIDKLQEHLNANAEFVKMLGRQVKDQGDLVEESAKFLETVAAIG